MIRDMHPQKGEAGFVWRGGDPTRVEALSDMVFAFALTLLVVSNQPPGSFSELTDQLWGFPGFAAAFALLLLIWHGHYIYFRRYALVDAATTTLNAGLLFLILFFVYPLKYHATMLSRFAQSLASGAPQPPMSIEEARLALIILSLAYVAVFGMFALLYAHAGRKADSLDLSPMERLLTRSALGQQLAHVAVGALVVVVAILTPSPWSPFSGFLYFLVGPLAFFNGGDARKALALSSVGTDSGSGIAGAGAQPAGGGDAPNERQASGTA